MGLGQGLGQMLDSALLPGWALLGADWLAKARLLEHSPGRLRMHAGVHSMPSSIIMRNLYLPQHSEPARVLKASTKSDIVHPCAAPCNSGERLRARPSLCKVLMAVSTSVYLNQSLGLTMLADQGWLEHRHWLYCGQRGCGLGWGSEQGMLQGSDLALAREPKTCRC